MKISKVTTVLFVATALGAMMASAAADVEKKGVSAKIKQEHMVSGHLAELNGKYKLRVTEIAFEPGGYVGEHHHAGPGLRYVASGELTFVQGNKTTIYKTGDYFYESGDITHTAYNKTNSPVRLISFEILPGGLKGTSQTPAPSK